MPCTFHCCTLTFPNFFPILSLISTWMMLYKSFLIHIYSVLVPWKNRNISGKIREKSWNLIPKFGWKPCIKPCMYLKSYIATVIASQRHFFLFLPSCCLFSINSRYLFFSTAMPWREFPCQMCV